MCKCVMPPRIVLGLTGPWGSGCTTLAGYFDNPDEFDRSNLNPLIRQLILDGYIKEGEKGIESNWEKINDDIKAAIKAYDQSSHLISKEREFKALKVALERRELFKVVEFIRPYFPADFPHYFRTISMSDLIVFRALCSLEAEGEELGQNNFSEGVKCFIRLGKDSVSRLKERLSDDDIQSLGEYVEKEANPLIRIYKDVHREVQSLKKGLKEQLRIEYVEVLQDFGNNLRRCGNPFDGNGDSKGCSFIVAQDIERVIDLIYLAKEASFFVIDGLRNPNEVEYLRNRYAKFYLLSSHADCESRKRRVASAQPHLFVDGKIKDGFEYADKRDSGKEIKQASERLFKQDVPSCVKKSDYAINNLKKSVGEPIHMKLFRLVSLMINPGSVKPTKDEVFMNLASTMSLKSNCICRQVGAVIAGKKGYIVGAGWNDVSQESISCGLRHHSDMKLEHYKELSDFVIQENGCDLLKKEKERERDCFCIKDIKISKVLRDKIGEILEGDEVSKDVRQNKDEIAEVISKSGQFHQLDYCPALHAEENAILQGSAIGGSGIDGSTMYVTSQPCSLCSKKIKQVGIKKVIYIEPYEKSHPGLYMNGVDLKQFEGVKPRSYFRLFMPDSDQKESQELYQNDDVPGFSLESNKYLYAIG